MCFYHFVISRPNQKPQLLHRLPHPAAGLGHVLLGSDDLILYHPIHEKAVAEHVHEACQPVKIHLESYFSVSMN